MVDLDVRALVLESLADIAPDADLKDIDESRSFHDQFEIDSVDFLNFILSVERRIGTRIPEADYPKLSSLAGAVAFLQELTSTSRRESVT